MKRKGIGAMFINHTNHTSERWSEAQLKASEKYGTILDVPFPAVAPEQSEAEVRELAERNAAELLMKKPDAVLCQGEYTYTFCMVEFLKAHGIPVLAACSKRVTLEVVDEYQNTRRESSFEFVRYRQY